ncbi:MAG: hypothetical protein BGN92_04310 [Sphingobacteriales bacterium 41-5]|nr:MAG: hypothetical protein BGN92_04310 [Sphingobacteriales bacterium 41-5]
MEQQEIIQLLNAIGEQDDTVAFTGLYKYYFSGLVSFAHSIVKDRPFAEQAVENVFVRLWQNRKTLLTIKNISHYLYVSVKHESLNFVSRQKSIHYEEFGDDFMVTYSNAETLTIGNENLMKISFAINSLPPRCKLIFRLVKEERLKYSEVAQLLEISIKTVEAQLTIALEKISGVLQITLPEYHIYYKNKKSIKKNPTFKGFRKALCLL